METPDARTIYDVFGDKYRLALDLDETYLLIGLGVDKAVVIYHWETLVSSVSHMTQVAHWQGYTTDMASGELDFNGHDCNFILFVSELPDAEEYFREPKRRPKA